MTLREEDELIVQKVTGYLPMPMSLGSFSQVRVNTVMNACQLAEVGLEAYHWRTRLQRPAFGLQGYGVLASL